MKRYLYLFLLIAVLALQACSGAVSPTQAPADGGLIPPVSSDGTDSSSMQGAAGAASGNATVPALCKNASDTNTASFATEVIRLVNVQRAAAGLGAVTARTELTQAAQTHAIDMGCNLFMSHTGSDGSSALDRIIRFGYPYNWWGENVAAGWSTPAAVMTAWMNSQPHRDNILNPNFTEIGIGYVYNSRDTTNSWYHYWSMSLGRPQ